MPRALESLQLSFNSSGALETASINGILLDGRRITHHDSNETNYAILHQLVSACHVDRALQAELHVTHSADFAYLATSVEVCTCVITSCFIFIPDVLLINKYMY